VIPLDRTRCAFCPMRSVTRCNVVTCDLPLCRRHCVQRSGGKLCRKHAGAVLIQCEGIASERFGNRGGDARPNGT